MPKRISNQKNRTQIDAEFTEMSNDNGKEALLLSKEFSKSDWEAFLQAEENLKKSSNGS